MNYIILYQKQLPGTFHFREEENSNYRKLKHLASELIDFGIDDPEEIEKAVRKSIRVIKTLKMNERSHFMPVLVCRDGQIIRDWKLSTLAQKLVILNASPDNPYVARLQLKLAVEF